MSTPGGASYRTGIGTSTADTITLLGHDLARDLIGQVGFGELAFWLLTKRRPTPPELAMFEGVLVSLTDHGFTPRRRCRVPSPPACSAADRGSSG